MGAFRPGLDIGLELVRVMLRDGGAWCRLEVEGEFAVHVGYDQYLYVGSGQPCEEALARTRALGLFPERMEASPYDVEFDEESNRRPADDDFWVEVRGLVADGRAGVLEELRIDGLTRWHHLDLDTLGEVRAGLGPRVRLAVWPPLSPDVDGVFGELPADDPVEVVWRDRGGRVHSVHLNEGEVPGLTDVQAVAVLSTYFDGRKPLCEGVLPDSDGVLRARWGT